MPAFSRPINNNNTYSPVTSLAPLPHSFTPDIGHNPYSPLLRRLSYRDFEAIQFPDGGRAFFLRQSTGVALWWTLNCISDDISLAGVSPIRFDPAYPAAVRSYIPDMLFERIGMPRPEVLKAIEIDSFNPLYLVSTIPNIVALWTQLQRVGLLGLAWIKEAKSRCQTIGAESGWDWSFYRSQLIDLPSNSLPANSFASNPPDMTSGNALGLHFHYGPSSSNGLIPESVQPTYLSSVNSHNTPTLHEYSKEMVLHPIHSHYAKAHPDYNVFSQELLIDNGFIDVKMKDPEDVAGDEDDSSSTISSSSSFFSDSRSSSSSIVSSTDFSSCHSFSGSASPAGDFYYTPLPVVIDDRMEVDSIAQNAMTATDLAANGFMPAPNAIVDA